MEAIETRYRTHTNGQLRRGDVGKEVRLAGWCHSYRESARDTLGPGAGNGL